MIIVHRFVVILNFYRFSRLKNVRMYRAYCELEKRYFFIIFTKPYFELPRPGLFVEKRTIYVMMLPLLVLFLMVLQNYCSCGCFDFIFRFSGFFKFKSNCYTIILV